MTSLRTILIVFYMCLPCIAQAITVDHLNQATIPVKDRTTDTLHAAFAAAFKQVLIKLSGNTQVMTLPSIQNAEPDLQRWIQSYTYIAPQPDDQQTQPASQQLQLQVQFDHQGVVQLLQESGQSIWPADRPLTLIAFDAAQDHWQPLVKQVASAYGVPIVFAVMDLSDQSVIQLPDAVAQLEKRYGVSSVLIVHVVSDQASSQQLRGQYTINGNMWQWTLSSDSDVKTIQGLIARLMDSMMQQLSNNDNVALQSKVTVNIMGVHDIADYAKVMHYLRQREDVMNVSVKDINGSGVLFVVRITGGISQFQKILADDGRLKVINSALAQNVSSADLYYYW